MSVEALRAYAEETRDALGFPGLSVAVTDSGGLLASEAFGLANLDAGTPVTRSTRFELGSIGKTFTATIALQLREEGRLDLDQPLTRYLPWFEVRSDHAPITIRHLLTHTSGLITGADQSSSSRYDVWALRDTEVGFPPGSRYLYSNVGYRTLGFVLEDVTEMRYPDLVRTRILAPLGLEATDPEIATEGRRRLAVAYERLHDDRPARRSDPWMPAPWLETATADGCLAGTMDDLAGFLRALLNGGQGLLSPESFALMTSPATEGDDGWWYGCGLELRGGLIRHGGSMPGFGTTMLGDLDSGLGVVVAANATDEEDLTAGIADALLDLYRGGTTPPVSTPPAVEDAAGYAGVYEGEAGRFVVAADGDRLLLDGRPLEARRRGRYVADRPGLALFVLRFRRENGRVVSAVHGGDVYRREGVLPAPVPPAPAEWHAFTGHYRAYNPWYSNFRVVLREGELLVIFPWGLELPLEPLPDGRFRAGDDWSPERLRFDAVADGKALRVDFSGEAYYRLP
ncbi:MAG TPA: serine hydrolase domain-containing protein [Gaiellaceae bacterium]|nr:serine hydrolase domain-containing protein [Gaiellaceae bacterium]